FYASHEVFTVTEQVPIMTQIVDRYFKSTLPNGIDIGRHNVISLFWHNLKRPFDSEGVVDIHHRRRRIASQSSFHVMSHNSGPHRAVGPKPNEGDLIDFVCASREHQQIGHRIIDGPIHRPVWELQIT